MAARRKTGKASSTVRGKLESVQEQARSRLDDAGGQVRETLANLESLVHAMVRRALRQLGVPSAEEIAHLTQRVEELNASVQALSARDARRNRKPAGRRTARTAASSR